MWCYHHPVYLPECLSNHCFKTAVNFDPFPENFVYESMTPEISIPVIFYDDDRSFGVYSLLMRHGFENIL